MEYHTEAYCLILYSYVTYGTPRYIYVYYHVVHYYNLYYGTVRTFIEQLRFTVEY